MFAIATVSPNLCGTTQFLASTDGGRYAIADCDNHGLGAGDSILVSYVPEDQFATPVSMEQVKEAFTVLAAARAIAGGV